MTRYLSLGEYLWLAEQVTGTEATVLAKAARLDLADSALHAPAAGFGDEDFYPDLIDKAGATTSASPTSSKAAAEVGALGVQAPGARQELPSRRTLRDGR